MVQAFVPGTKRLTHPPYDGQHGTTQTELVAAAVRRAEAHLEFARHRRRRSDDKAISADDVKAVVASEVEKVLAPVAKPLAIEETKKPFVILVVGVNGSGK